MLDRTSRAAATGHAHQAQWLYRPWPKIAPETGESAHQEVQGYPEGRRAARVLRLQLRVQRLQRRQLVGAPATVGFLQPQRPLQRRVVPRVVRVPLKQLPAPRGDS